MKYLIFDTETTGLPPKNANWETDYLQFPFIVQIAWKFLDDNYIHDFMIKPDGYVIPDEVSKIHGITQEMALEKGKDFDIIMDEFIEDCLNSDKIIAHNIYFDTSIIKANILKLSNGIRAIYNSSVIKDANLVLDKSKRIDTMRSSIKFCNLPGKRGLKYPTLEELYYKLFNETFPAHNAKEDVLATERCFKKLVELNIIKL